MPKAVAANCPRCGAPVSPGHTLLTCEFCGSELMMVKTNVGPPVPDYAAAGAMPAPPHVHVPPPPQGAGPGALVIVALAALFVIGGMTAGIVALRATSAPPPPALPPGVTTDGTSVSIIPATPTPPAATPAGSTDPMAMVGAIGFLDARCNAKDAHSCVAAGMMYQNGNSGLPADKEKAKAYFAKACAMGDSSGCTMQKQVK